VTSLNKYISLAFAFVIAFGMTVSSVHIHIDDFHDVETEHVLAEEELHCTICGAITKTDAPGCAETAVLLTAGLSLVSAETKNPTLPFFRFQDGRAPPSIGA
jgi:hypothetical protein